MSAFPARGLPGLLGAGWADWRAYWRADSRLATKAGKFELLMSASESIGGEFRALLRFGEDAGPDAANAEFRQPAERDLVFLGGDDDVIGIAAGLEAIAGLSGTSVCGIVVLRQYYCTAKQGFGAGLPLSC